VADNKRFLEEMEGQQKRASQRQIPYFSSSSSGRSPYDDDDKNNGGGAFGGGGFGGGLGGGRFVFFDLYLRTCNINIKKKEYDVYPFLKRNVLNRHFSSIV